MTELILSITRKVRHPSPKLLETLSRALEWRVLGFLISLAVIYLFTGKLFEATALSFTLQVVLFIGHTIWYYHRCANK